MHLEAVIWLTFGLAGCRVEEVLDQRCSMVLFDEVDQWFRGFTPGSLLRTGCIWSALRCGIDRESGVIKTAGSLTRSHSAIRISSRWEPAFQLRDFDTGFGRRLGIRAVVP